MNETISSALPLFIVVVLGFFAGKIAGTERGGPAWLELLVTGFALPALVFTIVAGGEFGDERPVTFLIGTTFACYITFMLMFVVAVTVGRVRAGVAAFQASAASHGNVSHLGVPVAAVVFGAEGALAAALMLLAHTVLQAILVPLLNAIGRPKGRRIALVEPLRGIFANPMLVAVGLGVAVSLSGFQLPEIATRTLEYLGDAAIAGALFSVGVALACQRLGHVTWEVPVVVIFKLAVSPLLTLAILVLMGGVDPEWIAAAVLVAALPTSASLARLATRLDVYVNGAANCHLITTLVSVTTITVLLVLIAEERVPMTAAELFP